MNEDKSVKKNTLPGISKADLHIHTNYSDGKHSPEEIVEYVHKKTDLSVIAICDHDTIESACEARRIVRERNYDIEVVVGEEVSAEEGHVIGLFLKKQIKPGLSAFETIKEIRSQGGFAIAPHPTYKTRFKSPRQRHISMDGVGSVVLIRENFDAVEIANGNPFSVKGNIKAKYINRSLLGKSETGGSDAHIVEGVGMGYTLFSGHTMADLKKALEKGETQAYYKKWKQNSYKLLKYGLFMFPMGVRNLHWTIRHGFAPVEPEIVNIPEDYK